MAARNVLRRSGYALILTGLTLAVIYMIATRLFAHLYYLAQLLPLFVVSYLFLAWLVYLSRDGFLAFGPRRRPMVDTLGQQAHAAQDGLPERKISGEEVTRRVLVSNGLVQRSGDNTDADRFWHESMYVLAWSAAQLAVVSVILYRWFGIGSTLR